MRLFILTASLWALAYSKPEMYREKEDFQYSRSSSDEGSKQGYYGAQRGNMGGNYEKAHNMDSLAQHQMSSLVSQVDGELGEGVNKRTGSVYTAGKSRGVFGSGHYDLSNLKGRHFGEGASSDDLQFLLSKNSGYSDNVHSSANNARYDANQLQTSNSHYQSTGFASQHASTLNKQEFENQYSGSSKYEYGAQNANNYQRYLHGDNQEKSEYDQSNSNYDANTRKRLVSTAPVRLYVRPDSRVTIPVAAQTYDSSHKSFVESQNTDTSGAELLSNSGHLVLKPKHYESSYSYRKEWEKHDTQPYTVIPTENTIQEESKLYDNIQPSQKFERNFQNKLDTSHSQSSSMNSAYSSNIQNGYTNGFTATTKSAAANNLQYQSQLQGSVNSGSSNAHSMGLHSSDALSHLNSLSKNADFRPKSYQSSYSYHKSWERRGDPYVIQPVGDITNGQISQRLTAATVDKKSHSSHVHGCHKSQNYDNCDEKDIRRKRSYHQPLFRPNFQEADQYERRWKNFEDLGQQTQSQWGNLEDLGQQTQNQWGNLENLGQQTQNQWGNLEDLGQQTQNQWGNLEDLGQQTQNQWGNLENLGQQTQNQWGNLENLGQQTQHQWGQLENLGQQTQNTGGKLEDLGHKSQIDWGNLGGLSQQTQNQWGQLENIDKQNQNTGEKLEDLGHKTQIDWGNLGDLGQQAQNQWGQLEDLGQQTQNQWGKLENLDQQTLNTGEKLEDFGHQTQTDRKNLEDLSQQTQNQSGNSEALDKQTQGGNGQLDNLGQQTQNQWGQLENEDQQNQNTGEKLEDMGHQTQIDWGNLGDLGQQTQNQWGQLEDLGQQTQNQWGKLNNLDQQTINTGEKLEDFGHQTQTDSKNLEDLSQQTQNQWGNSENSDQHIQDVNGKLDNLGQQTQKQWGQLEDIGQQTQSTGEKLEDLGHQTKIDWGNLGDLSQQSQNQWGQLENVDQQNQNKGDKLEDLGHQSQIDWGNLGDLSQQTQNQWDQLDKSNPQLERTLDVQQIQNTWHGIEDQHTSNIEEQKQNGHMDQFEQQNIHNLETMDSHYNTQQNYHTNFNLHQQTHSFHQVSNGGLTEHDPHKWDEQKDRETFHQQNLNPWDQLFKEPIQHQKPSDTIPFTISKEPNFWDTIDEIINESDKKRENVNNDKISNSYTLSNWDGNKKVNNNSLYNSDQSKESKNEKSKEENTLLSGHNKNSEVTVHNVKQNTKSNTTEADKSTEPLGVLNKHEVNPIDIGRGDIGPEETSSISIESTEHTYKKKSENHSDAALIKPVSVISENNNDDKSNHDPVILSVVGLDQQIKVTTTSTRKPIVNYDKHFLNNNHHVSSSNFNIDRNSKEKNHEDQTSENFEQQNLQKQFEFLGQELNEMPGQTLVDFGQELQNPNTAFMQSSQNLVPFTDQNIEPLNVNQVQSNDEENLQSFEKHGRNQERYNQLLNAQQENSNFYTGMQEHRDNIQQVSLDQNKEPLFVENKQVENLQSAPSKQEIVEIPVEPTEKPGFWKSLWGKTVKAKDSVVTWFKS